ncbi:hypothetical protein EVA_20996, partial [gut metagenome]
AKGEVNFTGEGPWMMVFNEKNYMMNVSKCTVIMLCRKVTSTMV